MDENTVKMVPMDANLRNEFVSWIYRNWAMELDNLQAIEKMTFDRKVYGDKLSFIQSTTLMRKNATEKRDYWKDALDRYKEFSPLVEQFK